MQQEIQAENRKEEGRKGRRKRTGRKQHKGGNDGERKHTGIIRSVSFGCQPKTSHSVLREPIKHTFREDHRNTECRSKWKLRRITVSRKTLHLIEAYYPAIREDLSLRRFLQYILFNSKALDLNSVWDGEGIPVGAEMIAWCEGKLKQHRQRNHHAEPFLKRARDGLFEGHFSWNRWEYSEDSSRFRTIKYLWIYPEVLDAVEKELSRPVSKVKDRVYFDTGEAFTRQARSDADKSIKQNGRYLTGEALKFKGTVEVPQKILSYMNGLPRNGFTQIIREYIDDAYEAMNALPTKDRSREKSRSLEQSKNYARAMLRHIDDSPIPRYHVSPKTHRLYAPKSLQGLNREIRSKLIGEWIDFDLASAHLAICSKLWDVPCVYTFLKEGGRIWGELLPWMKTTNKNMIKEALYAVIYGAATYRGRKTIKRKSKLSKLVQIFMSYDFAEEEAFDLRDRFMAHPYVDAMYSAREKRKKEIAAKGYIVDYFGCRTHVDEAREISVLSLLSAEAHAVEMLLLAPAFELAIEEAKKSRPAFRIMLYAFDGFYVKVRDKRRESRWMDEITRRVDEQAKVLDIPTRLERS